MRFGKMYCISNTTSWLEEVGFAKKDFQQEFVVQAETVHLHPHTMHCIESAAAHKNVNKLLTEKMNMIIQVNDAVNPDTMYLEYKTYTEEDFFSNEQELLAFFNEHQISSENNFMFDDDDDDFDEEEDDDDDDDDDFPPGPKPLLPISTPNSVNP